MKALDFLKEVYLFKGMADAELRWLAEKCETRSLIAGDNLFREGDAADCMYVVQKGTLEITKKGSKESQKLATLGPRSILGEIGYVERQPRSATAEATEHTDVLVVPFKAFDERIKTDTAFGMKLYQAISHQLVKTIQRTTSDLTTIRELKLRNAA